MLTIEPTGAVLGATVRGIDLARPLREPDLGRILLALGKHGVLPLSLVGYKASALTYASTHDRQGRHKTIQRCTLPLPSVWAVSRRYKTTPGRTNQWC